MNPLPLRSIRSLYSLALAEGEGMGTAYEYFVKRLVLAPWLAKLARPKRLLIAGLPEKFGFSLDLLLLGHDMAIPEIVIIDERSSALEGMRRSLAVAQANDELIQFEPRSLLVSEIDKMTELTADFGLGLSFGVLQRLDPTPRRGYIERLKSLTGNFALFAPNADDPSYERIGMAVLTLTDFRQLIESVARIEHSGYIDMPPWPPGITQSSAQRAHTAGSPFAGLAMSILQQYARLEKIFPFNWRKRRSHNLYALMRRSDRFTSPP